MARDAESLDATKREVREMNFASAQTSQKQVNELRGTSAADEMSRSPEIVVVSIPDVSTLRPVDPRPTGDGNSRTTPYDEREVRADLTTDGAPSNLSALNPSFMVDIPSEIPLATKKTTEIAPRSTTSTTSPTATPAKTENDAWWYSLASLAHDRPIVELSRRILAQFPSIAPATLLIASADPDLSTNRSTARVAACVARLTGCRVLLVDANWEANIGPVKQSGGAVLGLAEVVADNRPWKELVIETQESQLFVLPCGISEVPMRRVAIETLLALNAQWQNEYTYVFINAGHVKQLVTRRFAASCDGTYILVGLNQTTKKDAQAAMKLMAENHARVLGAIVFDAPPRS